MKYIKYKSAQSNVMNTVFKLILVLIVLAILIYIAIKWVIPLFHSAVSCESSGGYWYPGEICPKNEKGIPQPKLEGFQGSPGEGHICCFGEETESQEQGSEGNLSSEILSKCKDNICYSYSNADGYSAIQVMKKYPGDECLTLVPKDNPKNGELLLKKKVKFTSVIKGKRCCVMQFGGIKTDTYNYFTGKNVNNQFKRVYSDIDKYGNCKVELEIDFNDINKYFNYAFWKKSNQTWNRLCGDNNNQQKAMFKLDVMYWENYNCSKVMLSSEIIKSIEAGYSTLINVKELDIAGILYNNTVQQQEEQHLIFKVLTRKNIDSDISGNDFKSVVKSLYNTGTNLRADVCEFYCADEDKKICSDLMITYSTDRKYRCLPGLYTSPDITFVKSGRIENHVEIFNTPNQERKFCIAYRETGDDSYKYDYILSECNTLVFFDPKNPHLDPSLYCDKGVDSCDDITNSYICDNGAHIFGTSNSVRDSFVNFYHRGYCDNELFDCFYEKENKECLNCGGVIACGDYNTKTSCEDDPCIVDSQSKCFWDSEKDECFSCPSNLNNNYGEDCGIYFSKKVCEDNACHLKKGCYWERGNFLGFLYKDKCLFLNCAELNELECNNNFKYCRYDQNLGCLNDILS